ncbi:MAG: FKBP-type peptidyl-prolyl cis-trans isomerase [Pseudomonadota bacterium]
MKTHLLIIAGAAALLAASCGGSDTDVGDAESPTGDSQTGAPAETEDGSAALPDLDGEAAQKLADQNRADAEAFLTENAEKEGVQVTESGLQYLVLSEGPEDGATPISTDLVVVDYVGTLTDGVEFDSSIARGATASFRLNQVIPGWTEGVQLMSEGDKYRFFIPPDLAYGERVPPGSVIGPNSALIFDVELHRVHNAERNLEKAQAFLAENAKNDGVKTTDSGLQYLVLAEGAADGVSPAEVDFIEVHYEGSLEDGQVFDSSYARGETLKIDLINLIDGWREGIQLMSVGDKFKFFIPPDLAYGSVGTPGGPIGPNETLIFDVELLDVQKAAGPTEAQAQ